MSKIRFVAYLNDNYIYLLDNKIKKLYEKKFDNIKNDQILNEHSFYFEFVEFIKKNKIKIPIFGYKINFIVNDDLNQIQRNKYKEIFEDYFQKISFINLTDVIALSKDAAVINITTDYIDYCYLNKGKNFLLRIDKRLFNKNDYKAINYIINNLYAPKKLTLFGSSNVIPELTNKINKELGVKCTFQEKYSIYILNEYIKANTQ